MGAVLGALSSYLASFFGVFIVLLLACSKVKKMKYGNLMFGNPKMVLHFSGALLWCFSLFVLINKYSIHETHSDSQKPFVGVTASYRAYFILMAF